MSSTVKRVISHPDEVGRNQTKISKQSSQTQFFDKEDKLTPAMGSLTILSSDVKNNTIEPAPKNIVVEEDAVEESDGDKIVNITTSPTEGKQPIQTSGEPGSADGEGKALEENHPENSGFARQVSVDTSNKNIQTSATTPPRVIEVVNASGSSTSVIRNKSESTVSSAAGTSAAAEYGWFEDIHDHSSKGNKSPDGDKKGRRGSRQKTGLLLFDDLVNPLNAIVASVPKKKNGGKEKVLKCQFNLVCLVSVPNAFIF